MTASILVGYSPEGADQGPVNFGIAASRFTGAPLVVAAVNPGGSRSTGCPEGIRRRGGRRGGRTGAAPGGVGPGEVDATIHVVEQSSPARSLAQAVELHPGLLVIGSTHRGGLGRLLPGARQSALIHGSPCPVVVVPHGYEVPEQGVRTVGAAFVPTDEAERTAAAAVLARAAGAAVLATMAPAKHAEEQAPGLMARAHHEQDPSEDRYARQRMEAANALEQAIAELAADVEVKA